MYCKEILSPDAVISTEVIEIYSDIEGECVLEYGIEVTLSVGEKIVSRCVIPGISNDISFVREIARKLADDRVTPARCAEYVENELSK